MTTGITPRSPLEILISFGLEERAARLYISLLELGSATVLQLSRKSGVERTVIYYLLKELRRYGLIQESYDSRQHLTIIPCNPDRLMELEKERHQKMKAVLPELKALYQDQPKRPRVQIFEGLEGIDALYDDLIITLKELPQEQREMLTYSSVDLLTALPIHNQQPFREKRKEHRIRVRVISHDSEVAREFRARDQQELRESRLLPDAAEFFTATFVIYGDKVAQYSLKGEYFALVIESPELARLQRHAFDLAWEEAGRRSAEDVLQPDTTKR